MDEKTFLSLFGKSCLYKKNLKYGRDFIALEKTDKVSMDHSLLNSWVAGGETGGSCWNDENTKMSPRSAEKQPPFESLETVLCKICPNITFLQFRQLSRAFQEGTYSHYEYYGNWYEYTYEAIKLQDLFDKLKELELI